MKGVVFHWDSPWKDIYSGLDPAADAWALMGRAFDLEVVAIAHTWPFPGRSDVTVFSSLPEFLEAHADDRVVLADYVEPGEPNPDLAEVDWLVFGPADGWQRAHSEHSRWCYRPSPPGGFHAIHLAHIAAHMNGDNDGDHAGRGSS
jgi:hypothetical protein